MVNTLIRHKYLRYKSYNIDNLEADNIDRISTSMIPKFKKVLELGCSTGYLTRYLVKNRKCVVTGVEINRWAGFEAKKWAKKIIIGDLNSSKLWKSIKETGKYEVIFASAILEHLIDPWLALKRMNNILIEGGVIVVTVPNVSFWKNRIEVLMGRWNYQDYGILDRTHNKYFTVNTIKESINNAGFRVVEVGYDPAGGVSIFTPIVKLFPNLYAYQVAIKAIKI